MTIIRWLGQACFLLMTLGGTHILLDPPNPQVGYAISAHSLPADLVFVSHEHPDHNYVQAATGTTRGPQRVIQPIPLTGQEVETLGTYSYGPAGVEADKIPFHRIAAYHDDKNGALRGPDTITVLQTGGLRIVHLGDIGQAQLRPDQIKDIGRVDVLMIPVGNLL